jgi:hypothetical protein
MTIRRKYIFIFILFFVLIINISKVAKSAQVYPQDTNATFEYNDNVTREKLQKDYQYGLIWRLYTGFGIKDLIPVKGLDTRAEYTLGMRDVNTTNDEDYNSHTAVLSTEANFKTGTSISLEEVFKIWNSQSDLYNFYDNSAKVLLEHGEKTITTLSYATEQKWFQDKKPEIQARNFYYHQFGLDINHNLSESFGTSLGYTYQFSVYNRSPIDFKGGKPVVLDGVQRDNQNVFTLRFWGFLLNNTRIELTNQLVSSRSNSRAFNFNGNRTSIAILSTPLQRLSLKFIYRIVAYELGAYQTPTMGYELSEIRTDDQSGMEFGINYKISDQMLLQLGYEHIENTVFLTREFYRANTFSTGLRIKF